MIFGNRAGFSLVIDGTDFAAPISFHLSPGSQRSPGDKELAARFKSLSIREKLGEAADTLDIELSNHDGALKPIRRGVFASLSLGWVAGPQVSVGLVDKGRFLVDEVEKSGPPDILRIRAHSADLTGDYRRRRDRGWTNTTLGAVLQEIAGANGLTARVDASLASIALPAVEQAAKSDAALLRDLGARYDAIATVKNGTLIFLPVGAADNASGTGFGAITLTRQQNSRFRFLIADREEHDGAEAKWHDRNAATGRKVTAGAGANPKRIKRSFASEAEAKAAAEAETRKAARGRYEFEYEMALGDPGIEPNARVALHGWDSEIDGIAWIVDETSHALDANGGLTSSLRLVSVLGKGRQTIPT